jgi:hypothetical protein
VPFIDASAAARDSWNSSVKLATRLGFSRRDRAQSLITERIVPSFGSLIAL